MIYNKGKIQLAQLDLFYAFLHQELTNEGLNDFSQGVRRVHMQPPAGAQSYSGGGKQIKRGGKKYTNKKDKLTQDIRLASRYEI